MPPSAAQLTHVSVPLREARREGSSRPAVLAAASCVSLACSLLSVAPPHAAKTAAIENVSANADRRGLRASFKDAAASTTERTVRRARRGVRRAARCFEVCMTGRFLRGGRILRS
jgi:hypothetical protein